MIDTSTGPTASVKGQVHGTWRIVRIALLSVSLALAGCGKSDLQSSVSAQASASVTEPAISADQQQWNAWFEHCSAVRSIGESATTAQDGKVALENTLQACRSYSKDAPASQAKHQINEWIAEAESWIRFFTAADNIESKVELDQFESARQLLSSARQDMHEHEIQKFTQLIDSHEAELLAEWIPSTHDMPGFQPGNCHVARLARNLDDVERWMSEHQGWIRVIDVYRTPEHITIDHYDGLLKMRGTRIFYKDMATCKSIRGE